MKKLAFRVLPLLSGALLCGVAGAQETPARPANALNVMVAPLPAASPSEALLALAKAANVNVLADVDDANAVAVAPAGEGKNQTLFAALKAMTGAQGWTWRRASDETFLLWKQPDFVALARQIRDADATPIPANADNAAAGAAPTLPAAPPEALNVALTRFFATPAARNDPKNPADWREVPLVELPPELRERIIESVRATQRGGLQFAAAGAVLGDEFWQTAVLKVRELNVPAPRSQLGPDKRTPAEMLEQARAAPNLQKYLFIAGEFTRDGRPANTMLSLGRWAPEKVGP